MNKLKAIETMGFKITWKLIFVGLFGHNLIPIQLTYDELFDYLDGKLGTVDENTDSIIQLFCEKDDINRVNNLVCEFANKEYSEVSVQEKKWRAYVLKSTLDNLSSDCLQAILQLIEFWTSMGMPEDCPQEFPKKHNEKSKEEYFSPSMLTILIAQNTKWLKNEIKKVIGMDHNQNEDAI